ncbi:hypothetical protein FPV67DRAFT_85563 [Lyophyllum atratum]|nr:hypothetical protein FPV67DRAFT_85563 [Lyophyllum atratum]
MLPEIWWSNAVFFVSVHVAATLGAIYWPPHAVPRASLILSLVVWQFGTFGITVGYHRLYSHRAFRASLGTRVLLAAMGSSAFQGSIKWWCLRHRLHHRFTDDPVHDPYAATRGLFYSHIGWIFFKPKYERLELVDREDLLADSVVRYQHAFYVPLAILFGFIIPTAVASLWGDVVGGFVWGGLVSKLAIWHCTFLVNSLAHWDGLQPYSDEDTSRGSLLLALLTGGEGNHNFHAFPHDFRSGPSLTDWDPSKWIILILHGLGLVHSLRRAKEQDLVEAAYYMRLKSEHGVIVSESDAEPWGGAVWSMAQLNNYIKESPGRCVIQLDGFAVDATKYLGEHPGGAGILRKYSKNPWQEKDLDASWAFGGGLNNHSRSAKRQVLSLRVAKIQVEH